MFVSSYAKISGVQWTIVQSYGGSSRQALRVVRHEQKVDVVTLGLFSDVDSLRKGGLIASGWQERLPNHEELYTSTIVFVVRRGNPSRPPSRQHPAGHLPAGARRSEAAPWSRPGGIARADGVQQECQPAIRP